MMAQTTRQELLTDLASRIRTFTLLNWCGLPYNLNPRKIAKIGFINTEVNKITCVSCNVSVQLREHLNFCGDEVTALKWYTKIKQVHLNDCLFKDASQHKFPVAEFGLKELDALKFNIMNRKIVYLKGQQILAALMKTYLGIERVPVITKSCVATLRKSIFPADFSKLLISLKKLSSGIYNIEETHELQSEDIYPVPALLSLCGWRVQQTENQQYFLECPSCFRKIDSNILVLSNSHFQSISSLPDTQELTIDKPIPPFEFDAFEYHYSHCYFSATSHKSRDPAFLILSRLLQVKFDQDPSLSTLITLAQQQTSVVPSLSSHLSFKASAVSSYVSEQIIERLKDRQLVQSVLASKQPDEEAKSLIGKRERTYEEVKTEVLESLESSRKRLKVYENETTSIAQRDEQFKAMMDQYLSKNGGDIEVIGAPAEVVLQVDQTESENIEYSKNVEEEVEVDEDKSQVNSEYPGSQDLINESRESEML